jgi:ArsR family transcriptional regulator
MRMTAIPSPIDVRPTSGLLKALADDTRLRIVALLSRGELCVCHIASALDVSQPNASQHLTVLRNAGVVDSRRQGSWIYYRMCGAQDPVRAPILRAILDGFAELEAAVNDRRRLAATKDGVTCE